jgi:hypothetical protein
VRKNQGGEDRGRGVSIPLHCPAADGQAGQAGQAGESDMSGPQAGRGREPNACRLGGGTMAMAMVMRRGAEGSGADRGIARFLRLIESRIPGAPMPCWRCGQEGAVITPRC